MNLILDHMQLKTFNNFLKLGISALLPSCRQGDRPQLRHQHTILNKEAIKGCQLSHRVKNEVTMYEL